MQPITRTLAALAVLATVPVSAVQAQSMSGAEKQALIANMLQADSNNDGVLYLSEFELLIKLNAEDGLGKAALVKRTGAYDKAFKKLDSNGDGAVTKEEAQQLAEGRG
jgi:Ca2+-binding EF-hand superfamily protein